MGDLTSVLETLCQEAKTLAETHHSFTVEQDLIRACGVVINNWKLCFGTVRFRDLVKLDTHHTVHSYRTKSGIEFQCKLNNGFYVFAETGRIP